MPPRPIDPVMATMESLSMINRAHGWLRTHAAERKSSADRPTEDEPRLYQKPSRRARSAAAPGSSKPLARQDDPLCSEDGKVRPQGPTTARIKRLISMMSLFPYSAISLRLGPASAPRRRRTSLRSMAPFPAHSLTAATRKPRWRLRSSGAYLKRYAGRQYLAMLLQQPPRKTRSAAWDGPGGSSGGDCL